MLSRSSDIPLRRARLRRSDEYLDRFRVGGETDYVHQPYSHTGRVRRLRSREHCFLCELFPLVRSVHIGAVSGGGPSSGRTVPSSWGGWHSAGGSAGTIYHSLKVWR